MAGEVDVGASDLNFLLVVVYQYTWTHRLECVEFSTVLAFSRVVLHTIAQIGLATKFDMHSGKRK